jgi:hypothetical protein
MRCTLPIPPDPSTLIGIISTVIGIISTVIGRAYHSGGITHALYHLATVHAGRAAHTCLVLRCNMQRLCNGSQLCCVVLTSAGTTRGNTGTSRRRCAVCACSTHSCGSRQIPKRTPLSAPGLGPSCESAPGLGSPRLYLHRDRAHPCHICSGTGLRIYSRGSRQRLFRQVLCTGPLCTALAKPSPGVRQRAGVR